MYPLIFGQKKARVRIEKARARRGSSDYNDATPMMRAILSKCVNEDLCHVMPHIQAPTLLIWGENDTATPLADAKKMEKLIPDAGLVSFPGCGHYNHFFKKNSHEHHSLYIGFGNVCNLSCIYVAELQTGHTHFSAELLSA